jgi:hypothetical protein
VNLKELRHHYDPVCLESRLVSWVEGKELMDLRMSSDRGKVPVFLGGWGCPSILFLNKSLLPVLSHSIGVKLLTCTWRLGHSSW